MFIKKSAFTLVELIVVITILSVLATVAFISFQWYTQSARDATRLANMKLIEKALSINETKHTFLPEPSNLENITFNNWGLVTLRNKWTIWKSVHQVLNTLSEVPIDPITWEEFGYALTLNKRQYELRGFLEWEQTYQKTITSSYANENTPRVRWNYNKLYLLWSDNKYYSVPSLFWSWADVTAQTSFDVDTQNINFQVVSLKNQLGVDITPDSFSDEAIYEDFWRAIQSAYSGSSLASNKYYTPYLNASSSDDFINQAKVSLGIISQNSVVSSGWGWAGWVTCTFDSSTFDNCNFQ